MGDNNIVTLDALVEEGIARVLSEIECLTPNDIALLQRMSQTIASAQAVVQFTNAHLATQYKLKPGDDVDEITGVITRASSIESKQ